jgi:hypothetical protein
LQNWYGSAKTRILRLDQALMGSEGRPWSCSKSSQKVDVFEGK